MHIVNKAGVYGSLPMEDFVRAVGQPPDVTIAYEREIVSASLLGAKGLADERVLGHALAPVLKEIAGETVEKPRSFINRLFD